MFHPEEKRPRVGVAAVVVKGEKVLMGRRLNAHGQGMWSVPGGHLEWNESWEQCAARETQEEAGLSIDNVRFLTVTNDVMYADNRHYITIFMVADYAGGEPRVMEPDKMVNWEWFDWGCLPEPLFYPITNLIDSGISPIPDVLTPEQRQIVNATSEYVRARLEGESTGHDWWHVYRVWKTARTILKEESADAFVVELSALLHDISDYKLNGGDTEAGARLSKEWLAHQHVDASVADHVARIVHDVSYKGTGVDDTIQAVEGNIVQDADRLDAMGAIGIARAFAFGGNKQRSMHDPEQSPELHDTPEAYMNRKNTTTINHFYEKLLLLKDRMKTPTGKRMAENRHVYMERFLEQFFGEWEGESGGAIEKKEYSKLVRDRIPEIIEANGEEPVARVANNKEYRAALKEKLVEESQEFVLDETPDEIADVFEVIDAICKEFGFDCSSIENIQQRKRAERGGFEEKIILDSVQSNSVNELMEDDSVEINDHEGLLVTDLPRSQYKEMTKMAYDKLAKDWTDKFDAHFSHRVKSQADAFITALSGKKILDLGCGPGAGAKYFQERGYDVLAADISEELLNECKHRGLQTWLMDMETDDLGHESYDGIWSHASLLHIPKQNITPVIEKVAKALKPGGILFLSMKEGIGEGYEERERFPGTRRWFSYYTQEELKQLTDPFFEIIDQQSIFVKNKRGTNTYNFLEMLFRKR